MVQRVPMTRQGFQKLRDELKHINSVERPKIVKEIEVARAHGDLSENAEYQYAKDKQGMIEARKRELEDKISRAEVIDPSKFVGQTRVVFGATVSLIDLDGHELTYTIVGTEESNVDEGLISIDSIIARGLIGKEEGDEVRIKTPSGLKEYEIEKVEYKAI